MRLPVHSLVGSRMSAPDMRNVNGIQLLNLMREAGPVSRARLAKLSGLSKPTVSLQVSRLIGAGLAVEVGLGEAGDTGGKRPTLVRFHASSGRVAGIAIGAGFTRLAVTDLDGKTLREVSFSTAPESGARKLRERIERALATMLAREGVAPRAIGIGVPGRVDCRSGIVLEAGSVFYWNNVDLRTPLEKRFGCPVCVDNDANAALVAELHEGAARNAGTAVIVRAETGVGSAVAIGGRIHHGANWAAGEIGHLAPDRSRKRVSPRGQLESVLGADQVARRVRAAAKRSAKLRQHLSAGDEIVALFGAAAEHDKVACDLAEDIAHHAAVAVANQVLAYDPEIVLLSGAVFELSIGAIRRFLHRTAPWSPDLLPAHFGETGVLAGAIHIALGSAYEQMARLLTGEGPARHTLAAGGTYA